MYFFCQLRRPRINDTLGTMSIPRDQILVSNPILQLNKIVLPRELTDFRIGVDNIRMILDHCLVPENKGVLRKQNLQCMSK